AHRRGVGHQHGALCHPSSRRATGRRHTVGRARLPVRRRRHAQERLRRRAVALVSARPTPPTRGGGGVIVCLRTVAVPPDERARYLQGIADGREVREAHGIRAEWVLEPSNGGGDTVVVTVWPSHEVFDAWIATPERDALTASAVHRSVEYRPITRYDVAGGYTVAALCQETLA